MGDLCVTIAKLTKLTKGLPPDEALLEGFKEMGERAEQMIRVALRSLEQRDRVAAESLARARRADRPREPARRQRTCSTSGRDPSGGSGGCG